MASQVPVPSGMSDELAAEYRETLEKQSALQGQIQQLRSEKIIQENTATQLKFNLESEREKLTATEMVKIVFRFV